MVIVIVIIYLSILCEPVIVPGAGSTPGRSNSTFCASTEFNALEICVSAGEHASLGKWERVREIPETGTLVTTKAWTLDMAEAMYRGRASQGHWKQDRKLGTPLPHHLPLLNRKQFPLKWISWTTRESGIAGFC